MAENPLQALFDRWLKDAPVALVERLIGEKLTKIGKTIDADIAREVSEQLLSAADGSIPVKHIDLIGEILSTVTEEEMRGIEEEFVKFSEETVPNAVHSISNELAQIILEDLKKNWPNQKAWETETNNGFKRRLEAHWGEAFDLLRMFLACSREWGQNCCELASKNVGTRSVRSAMLTLLHARSCQVAAEVVTLIENGFADGAMARWRTLHEVSVVATIIYEKNDEVALRYQAFEAVEAKRALNKYLRTHKELGFEAVDEATLSKVDEAYGAVAERFGPEMHARNGYGWASKCLSKKNPTFADLEEAAGRSSMRSHYNMASYGVHAGVKGLNFKLGRTAASTVVLAGASNTGFTEPAQNTGLSLNIVNMVLRSEEPIVDEILMLSTMSKLSREIGAAFARCEATLLDET